MYQYRRYAEQLEHLVRLCARNELPDEHRVERALNGEASEALYAKVPIGTLRRAGAFFTPQSIADKLVARMARPLAAGKRVLDPACGAGELLLACARLLPLESDLSATLAAWGRQLHGFDIHREFVLATKARLTLLAIARGARTDRSDLLTDLDELFPNICQLDFIGLSQLPSPVDLIVMNPPFQRVTASKVIRWGTGLVTQAAIFVEKCISLARQANVAALLPDVLRSGSRYARWRSTVTKYAFARDIEPLGVFNERADVDVFLVTLQSKRKETRGRKRAWLPGKAVPQTQATLETICRVRVGPVVPFRDPERGPSRLYVTTATLPAWKTTTPISRRRYIGEAFPPPFVAVRRTSRANDSKRAIATIVKADELVAAENHLLVLLPTKGTLKECKRIVAVLGDPRTTEWLNTQICCRHLTTRILRRLPLWDSDE